MNQLTWKDLTDVLSVIANADTPVWTATQQPATAEEEYNAGQTLREKIDGTCIEPFPPLNEEATSDLADVLEKHVDWTPLDEPFPSPVNYDGEAVSVHRRVREWKSMSDADLRLRCGELTAKEIRTVRAVLKAILPL